MKKIIFLLTILLPSFVLAGTCDVIKDTSTSDTRNLTCDKELSTVTTYKTSEDVEVLKNDVCTITCSEEIVFSFEPIKKVLAGMGFSYPLTTSGERKCSATYNYSSYEGEIRRLVNDYDSKTGDAKKEAKNTIVNYYAQKQACDEFNKEESDYKNVYNYTGNVNLNIETSSLDANIHYQFVETEDRAITTNIDEVFYDSCDLNDSNYSCKESDKTIGSWTSSTRIFGKYTMPDYYIQKYTGKKAESTDLDTCNAKDKYFTDGKELSKPLINSPTDNGYKLTLTAEQLGNNLKGTKTWNLKVDCWYQVKNLLFPQESDENFEDLCSTGFMYRIIDLKKPFPNREPNSNWKGRENIISSTKDNLSSIQKFIITINRSNINKIKEYNRNHPEYDTFNLNEMERSDFIIGNIDVIDRK